MKTKDATKKQPQNRPQPFVPEFLQGLEEERETEAHTTEEIAEILAKPRV